MKLHIFRLGSVVPEGVGGTEAGAIDLIYSFLLKEYNCDFYGHIHINQIGDDLDEIIIKENKNMHINIKYPAKGFNSKSPEDKNHIRLDLVHLALLRIAENEKKLDVNKLEQIRDRILHQNFKFEFVYKQYENKKNQLIGKLLIHPGQEKFCYYFSTEKNGKVISKIPIYEGKCSDYYIRTIFYNGKWANSNEFIIKDKNNEVEIHVFIDENRIEIKNLTKYKNPPFFEMMKAGWSQEEASNDWLHSLPPEVAAILSHKPN